MALLNTWPAAAEHKADWERTIQFYGLCEVLPDRAHPGMVEKAFRDWAVRRRLVVVEGENLVAFDPKAFNPKDSLDRAKFGFLLRYLKPRTATQFRRDLETAFNIRSMYVLEAIKSYWLTEGIVYENGGSIEADREVLRLMGFSAAELINAMDGVVKREYLADVANGKALLDPSRATQMGNYVVSYEVLKERFFDAEFLIHAAGQPIALSQLGEQMGVDSLEDLREILRESKKRFDLNIEVTDDHVMFGPPSQKSIDSLITREKGTRSKLETTEVQLKDRLKTVKELLDRYNSREAKILNEAESLREEGRLLWIKSKIVAAASKQINGSRKGI